MKQNDVLGCIGLIVLTLAVSVLGIVLNAWALKTLWGWFVAPIFGIFSLRIIEAMGLSCILTFVISRATYDSTKDDPDWYKAIAYTIIHPVFAVCLGWAIVQFM